MGETQNRGVAGCPRRRGCAEDHSAEARGKAFPLPEDSLNTRFLKPILLADLQTARCEGAESVARLNSGKSLR